MLNKQAGCMECMLMAVALASAPAFAGEGVSPLDIMNAQSQIADQVQKKVLDPILGPGRSFVFAQAKLEFSRAESGRGKLGRGQSTVERGTAGHAKASTSPVMGQYAEQTTSENAAAMALTLKVVELKLQVLCDEKLPQTAADAAKKALLAVFKESLKPETLDWVSAPFAEAPDEKR